MSRLSNGESVSATSVFSLNRPAARDVDSYGACGLFIDFGVSSFWVCIPLIVIARALNRWRSNLKSTQGFLR